MSAPAASAPRRSSLGRRRALRPHRRRRSLYALAARPRCRARPRRPDRLRAASSRRGPRSTSSASASSPSRAWDPVKNDFGALDFIYGTLVHVVPRRPARGAARDRDRSVPDRARAARLARRRRHARRAARRDPERRDRASGGSSSSGRSSRTTSGRSCRSVLGWLPFFKGDAAAHRLPARPSIVLTIMILPITASVARELFRTVPQRSQGGLARARHDALGDDPRRRAAVHARRSRRGGDPRPRPRARRGDRRARR